MEGTEGTEGYQVFPGCGKVGEMKVNLNRVELEFDRETSPVTTRGSHTREGQTLGVPGGLKTRIRRYCLNHFVIMVQHWQWPMARAFSPYDP